MKKGDKVISASLYQELQEKYKIEMNRAIKYRLALVRILDMSPLPGEIAELARDALKI